MVLLNRFASNVASYPEDLRPVEIKRISKTFYSYLNLPANRIVRVMNDMMKKV